LPLSHLDPPPTPLSHTVMSGDGLLASLDALFGTTNLYEVLGVTSTAGEAEVKRGYRRRSLQLHPDRVPEKERAEATKKFQALGAAYKVLSDKDRRAVYDESGEVDEESDISLRDGDKDWDQYWRLLFQVRRPKTVFAIHI
jgi:DnaJ family protein C protein 9